MQIADAAENLEKQGFFDAPSRLRIVANPQFQVSVRRDVIIEQKEILLDFMDAVARHHVFGRNGNPRFAPDALDEQVLFVAADFALFKQFRHVDMLNRVFFAGGRINRLPDHAESARAEVVLNDSGHALIFIELHRKRLPRR